MFLNSVPSLPKEVIWIHTLNLTQGGDGYEDRLMLAMTEAVTQLCPVSSDTARLLN